MSNTETQPVLNHEYANNYPDLVPENTIVLHQDFRIIDLQAYQDHARRIKGNMQTIDAQSYFDYVLSRQKENNTFKSRTFVDANTPESYLQARTILNFGTNEGIASAGRHDDTATLNLGKDPMFVEFLKQFERTQFKSLKFAEALENFLGTIDFEAVIDGQKSDISSAISAFRNLKIKADQTSVVTGSQYSSEQSDLEQFEVDALGGKLPEYIALTTPIYMGLDQQTILFKIIMNEVKEGEKSTAVFSLKPIGLTYAYQKAAVYFQKIIRDNLKNEEVTIGVWE